MTFRNERDPKNTTTSHSLVKKKNRREASREKMQNHSRVFFFPLQRKAHNAEEENFVVREISLQTNKQQHERGQKREENKTENHGLLSLLLFAFTGAFLFEGVFVWWESEEEKEQKKHQSSSVDEDFSGCISTFKQQER
jgi:hypothetical protein